MAQLLYPVFIHCCLKLVAGKASNEATQLIARHSTRFTHVGGQPSKVRMQVWQIIPSMPCYNLRMLCASSALLLMWEWQYNYMKTHQPRQ